MIPIKDTARSKLIPFANYLIIAVCGVVFLLSLGPGFDDTVLQYGVVPARVTAVVTGETSSVSAIAALGTSMFIHGGWLHLIGNMLYLYIFGDAVEGRLGHLRYGLLYLLCGVSAGLVQVFSSPLSTIPIVGASGAIAGVLGAYFLLFPKAKVLTLIPLFVYFPVVQIPAFVFLGLWFLLQFFQALLSGAVEHGGVAWWAHAGGFIAGGLFLPLLLIRKKRR